MNAGLVDEFTIHYSPIFFGTGTPLLTGVDDNVKVRIKNSFVSRNVTHVMYELEKTPVGPKAPDLLATA